MSETFEAGDRIELDFCADPHTRLEPGEQGTVRSVDDTGTVRAAWDSGSTLGLNTELGDEFHKVPRGTTRT